MSARGGSAKNIIVKLIVGAGQAAPSPPVGPALGSKGVKAIDFCKEFNARSSIYQNGVPIPCLITIKPDRSFSFEMKSPSTSYLLMKAANIEKGGAVVGKGKKPVGEISLKHVYEIAKIKKSDERHKELEMEGIVKSIISSARTMGINVVV